MTMSKTESPILSLHNGPETLYNSVDCRPKPFNCKRLRSAPPKGPNLCLWELYVTTTIEPETRICSECCAVKPLTEYRRRHKGRDVRMHQCRVCHLAAERCRRLRRKAKHDSGRMQAISTAFRRSRNMNRIMLMLELGIRESGGVGNLMRDWHAAVRDNIDQGKSTPRLLGFYEAMVTMAIQQSQRTGQAGETTESS